MAKTAAELRAYNQARYAANREAVKARVRAYAVEHREEISASTKAYRAANKDKLRERAKVSYRAHITENIQATHSHCNRVKGAKVI